MRPMGVDYTDIKQNYVELHTALDAKECRKGTLLSTTILIGTSGIGAGMLTLPHAVQEAGLRGGILYLLLGACTSIVSTIVLGIGSRAVEADTYGRIIEGAVRSTIRLGGISIVDAGFFVYLLACVVAYLLFVGDFFFALTQNIPGGEWCTKPVIIYAVAFGAVGPLTCRNEMNFLQRAAGAGIFIMIFTCAVVVGKSVSLIPDRWDDIVESINAPMRIDLSSLKAFGGMLYAYDIGATVPAIASEMQAPTPRRLMIASIGGICLDLVIYVVLSFTVYFSFVGYVWPDNTVGTRDDFTKNFPSDDPMMSACRLLLFCVFVCVIPLANIPAMQCLYVCIGQAKGDQLWKPTLAQRAGLVYAALVPVAVLAANYSHVGEFVDWLGSFGACPEMLAGPMLLVAFGHVGTWLPPWARCLSVVTALAMMALLWSSAIAGFMQN